MNNWIKKQNDCGEKRDHDKSEDKDESENLKLLKQYWTEVWNIMQLKKGEFICKNDITEICKNLDKICNLFKETNHTITSNSTNYNCNSNVNSSYFNLSCNNANTSNISTDINTNHNVSNLTEDENLEKKYILSDYSLINYIVTESVLDNIFEWSLNIGEFTNKMKLQQLKLYEAILGDQCILFQNKILRPMLNVLCTCKDCAPLEVEKQLIDLLYLLCLFLEKNRDVLDVFFFNKDNNIYYLVANNNSGTYSSNTGKINENDESKFLIFSLLISFVHREGVIGEKSRECLLIILKVCGKDEQIGKYIVENTNFCPVLATGLSGLYSLLPRKLNFLDFNFNCNLNLNNSNSNSNNIDNDDDEEEYEERLSEKEWYQLREKDVDRISELKTFLNSFEFCNRVIRVSHTLVKQQLLEYILQGFLISVIGPALHQDIMKFPVEILEKYGKFSNTIQEIIATTAYLDLFLRLINQEELLKIFLKFIVVEKYDGQRILDTLISRINCNKKLSLITIVLFKTMLSLNCEDVIYELILKYLNKMDFLKEKCRDEMQLMMDTSRLERSAHRMFCMMSSMGYTKFDNFVDYLNDAYYAIRNRNKSCLNWSSFDDFNLDNITNDNFNHNKNINFNYDCVTNNTCSSTGSSSNNNNKSSNKTISNTTSSTSSLTIISNYDNKEESRKIGPFLSNLLNKFENFFNNDINTNLQVTGLIAILLSYRHPIIRSYLMLDCLKVDGKVRTIVKIVKNKLKFKCEKLMEKIEKYKRNHELVNENFEIRVYYDPSKDKGKTNIDYKEKIYISTSTSTSPTPSPSCLTNSNISNINNNANKNKENKKSKRIRDFWNRFLVVGNNGTAEDENRKNIDRNKLPNLNNLNNLSLNMGKTCKDKVKLLKKRRINEDENINLQVFIFQEFLKEFSAFCQEHYILENDVNYA